MSAELVQLGKRGVHKDHLESHAEAQAGKAFADREPLPADLSFRGYWVALPPSESLKE